MKNLIGSIAIGVLVGSSALAVNIDFEDGDHSQSTTPANFYDLCTANFYIETQGFAVYSPSDCTAYSDSYNGTLALYTGQRNGGGVPSVVTLYSLDYSRFDLAGLDLLMGASNRLNVEGYRDNQLVYSEQLRLTSAFIQRKELNWVDLDFVRFSGVDNAGQANAVGIDNLLVTSANSPRLPTLRIANAPRADEGDDLEFTVRLSVPLRENVTFDVETINGSAVSPDDYPAVQGSRVLLAGQTELTVLIPTIDDAAIEDDEQLTLRLSNPSNVQIAAGDDYAVGTIVNNDFAATDTIDFDAGDRSLIREGYSTAACIANVYIETKGFAFNNPGDCSSYLEYSDNGNQSLALYLASVSGEPVAINMSALDNSRFDLLEFDQLLGASRFIVVEGYRNNQRVYSEKFFLSSDFKQRHQLNWVGLDRVRFTSPPGAGLQSPYAAGIDNILVNRNSDESPLVPTLSIESETTAIEGEDLQFKLTLSSPVSRDVSFDVQTINETAIAPDDYLANDYTYVLAAGSTELTVLVQTIDDPFKEADESLSLRLSNLSNAQFADSAADAYGVGIITDNDDSSQGTTIDFNAGDRSLIRAGQGSSSCIANVYIETNGFAFNNPGYCSSYLDYNESGNPSLALYVATVSSEPAVINMSRLDSSRFDLLAFDQLLGASRFIVVEGYRDNQLVYSENFELSAGFKQLHLLNWADLDSVRFRSPPNTGLPYAAGIDNVVVNSDGSPQAAVLSIDNSPIAQEGDYLQFKVKLSRPVAENVTFDVDTVNGTAISLEDYLPKGGLRMLAAGQTERTIWVQAVDDDTIELNETMSLRLLNPTNAQLADGGAEAIGIIIDNDAALIDRAQLSVADAVASEGEYARFVITLSKPTENDVRITLNTINQSAIGNEDYEQKRGLRIIPAGKTRKTIWVELYNDDLEETDEQFELQVILQSDNAVLATDGFAEGTIIDRQ